MSLSEHIRDVALSAVPGCVAQLGAWLDTGASNRYIVIRQSGGQPQELIRRPDFTLWYIGAADESAVTAESAAESIRSALAAWSSGPMYCAAGEPVFSQTAERRPCYQVSISLIISL